MTRLTGSWLGSLTSAKSSASRTPQPQCSMPTTTPTGLSLRQRHGSWLTLAPLPRQAGLGRCIAAPPPASCSMGITYDEIVSLTHKRNRVIKRRHPKQLKEFAVKILMKWMLSEEHFDF
ncbi:unnamed protein product, partial [Symbiodinium sp. KB8]